MAPREEDSDLGFFSTTPEPRTSCLLLEDPTKDSFFESGELLQNIVQWKINPVNLELADERGQVTFFIHGSYLEVHVSTSNSISSLTDQLLGVRGRYFTSRSCSSRKTIGDQ